MESHPRAKEQGRDEEKGKREGVPSKVLRICEVSGSSSMSSTLSISTETSEKNGSSSGNRCTDS